MKQIKILVSFKDNEMIFPNIEFVKNDYNHVEFIFDFDEDDGKKVFELKKPNGKVFIKEIIDNKVLLSDFDEKGNIIPVINQSGLYEFEITKYKSDSKFTISKVCQFMARDEIVNIDDDIVDKDASLPILNDLITTTIALKENTEKIGQLVKEKGDYAEEQGNYAKEAASNVINANNQSTKLINNFESNVNEYTSDFNKKATTKQEKFDSNSTTKINEYNDNATSKLKQYNDNHESKLKDYNDNASEKTKAFNSNSLLKTTAYDKNADDKLSAYNTNGATKLDEYNDNATLKTEEYNTNASSKIEEYNSNATQKLEEYDEHSEELNNKINSTNSELEKLKDEILEIGETSDTFVHLEDSAMSKLKSLIIDGVCEQETTTGKNSFMITDLSQLNINTLPTDLTINKTNNIISFTSVNSNNNGIYILADKMQSYIKNVDITKNYYISADITVNSNANYKFGWEDTAEIKGTLKTGTTRLVSKFTPTTSFIFYLNSTNVTVTISNIMISESKDTTYEPYTGGQPSPSPDYPQDIKTITDSLIVTSCNKNLFDKNDENMFLKDLVPDNAGLILSGITNLSAQKFIRTAILKCKPNTTYTISKLASRTFYIYDSEKLPSINYRMRTILNNGTDKSKYTFTTSQFAKYIVIKFFNTWANEIYSYDEIVSSIQIEECSTQTSFVEHIQSQIIANLPEGEFIGKINDTYKDTLKLEYNEEDGQYHLNLYKNIGKVVLDGSESWGITSAPSNTTHLFQYHFNDNAITPLLCTHYIFQIGGEIWSGDKKAISLNTNNYYIQVRDSYDNTNDFKTWLSTHNTEVYYPLATPYTVDLGVVDMPLSYDEITNIFTDSDLMPQINAKYYKNFISTIRNLQVNNANLKNELMSINNRLVALESANASTISDEEESEVVNNE